MLIRRASSEDYKEIHALVDSLITARVQSDEHRKWGLSDEKAHKYPQITKEDLDDDLYVVALEGDEAVGLVHGSLYDKHHHRLDQLGYIEELFVREWYRGKGLAKDLFMVLEEEFKKARLS